MVIFIRHQRPNCLYYMRILFKKVKPCQTYYSDWDPEESLSRGMNMSMYWHYSADLSLNAPLCHFWSDHIIFIYKMLESLCSKLPKYSHYSYSKQTIRVCQSNAYNADDIFSRKKHSVRPDLQRWSIRHSTSCCHSVQNGSDNSNVKCRLNLIIT